MSRAASLALLLLASACQTAPLQPDPQRIAPWTVALREAQPDTPEAAIYLRDGRRLVFVAAQHATTTDSVTFRIIDDAYATMQFDTLIYEGPRYSAGANAQRDLDWLARQQIVDGFVEGGESVPAGRGALAQGAQIWGGEPDDSEILRRLRGEGFTNDDVLGFYVLRSIPQWERERRIDNAGDARLGDLIGPELERNRTRLGLASDVLPDDQAWRAWYSATNNKPLETFALEEVGPLSDGRYPTNRIGAAIGRARDAFLLETVARHLNQGERVIVVLGQSHFMMLRPALDDMLGPPCYVGAALREAPQACLR
jgi:hypothetical protein